MILKFVFCNSKIDILPNSRDFFVYTLSLSLSSLLAACYGNQAGGAEPAKAAAPKAKAEDDDDIDFFAEDEEEKPKTQAPLVRVQPKGPPPSVLAKQKEQAAKKKGKVDKAPAAAEVIKYNLTKLIKKYEVNLFS